MIELDKIQFVTSPNFHKGISKISFLVLHCPVGSYQSAINTFKNPASQVSAHFVVSQTGEVTQMVNLENTAWHCYGFNSQAIGIEMEDKGLVEKNASWQTPQLLETTAELVSLLLKKYELAIDAIVGHDASFIQSYAKLHNPSMLHIDPGEFWDMDVFKEKVKKFL